VPGSLLLNFGGTVATKIRAEQLPYGWMNGSIEQPSVLLGFSCLVLLVLKVIVPTSIA